MTTNVPQDVIDYTLVRDVAKMYGLDYNKLSAAYRELLRTQRQQGAEPVADDDSQMLVRHALGCLLEALKSSDREARLNNMDATKIVGEAIDFLKSYTTPPQANALVAAAYGKAAALLRERISPNDAMAQELATATRKLEEARKDAEGYQWLKSKAVKNTAYDRYGPGAHWTIGFYSENSSYDFDQAIEQGKGGDDA
jgi:hypothetical protein